MSDPVSSAWGGRADAPRVTDRSVPPELPALLDEQTLANLHEDFASTGDLEELADLIRNFLTRGEELLAAMSAALAQGDAEAVRAAAHKLKGSSRTLGAALIGAVANQLEGAGASGDLVLVKRRLPELEVVFALTRSTLGDMIDAIDPEGFGDVPVERGAPDGGGLHAVLADDEAIALAVLRAGVERLGHACTVVTDGDSALAAYERVRPQVVITDLQMPGIDGVELARRIRATGDSATYVVVLSASGDRGVPALGDTVDACLSKPVREDELRAVLALAAQSSA